MPAAGLELDADRGLALTYVPVARRPAVAALWRLDVALGQVLAGGREPLISQIKLAWWREALERLDRDSPPAEPVLESLAEHVLPAGISGAELAAMEEGWRLLLGEDALTSEQLQVYASGRGGRLFALTARLLGGDGAFARPAGESWALVDLARRSGRPEDVEAALAAARAKEVGRGWAPSLRPLGMLGALAARDAEEGRPHWEAQGAPGRMLRMLRFRLSGR